MVGTIQTKPSVITFSHKDSYRGDILWRILRGALPLYEGGNQFQTIMGDYRIRKVYVDNMTRWTLRINVQLVNQLSRKRRDLSLRELGQNLSVIFEGEGIFPIIDEKRRILYLLSGETALFRNMEDFLFRKREAPDLRGIIGSIKEHGLCSPSELNKRGKDPLFSTRSKSHQITWIDGVMVTFPNLEHGFKIDPDLRVSTSDLKTSSSRYSFAFRKYSRWHEEDKKAPTGEQIKDKFLKEVLYHGGGSILPVVMERVGLKEAVEKPQRILENRACNSIVCLVNVDNLSRVEHYRDREMEVTAHVMRIEPEYIEYILVPEELWETTLGIFSEEKWKGRLIRVGYTAARIELIYYMESIGELAGPPRSRILEDMKVPDYEGAIKEIAKKHPDKAYFAHGVRLPLPFEKF